MPGGDPRRHLPDDDPRVDFDERDLLAFAEDAGFREVRLDYRAEVGTDPEPVTWQELLRRAPNPLAPTGGEVLEKRAVFPGGRARLSHCHPRVTTVTSVEAPLSIGIHTMITDRTVAPQELAREVEQRGFDALLIGEHTHLPAGDAEALPDSFARLLDPFLALTAAGLATEHLLVGTGICLVAQRDPILLAREVASLDLLTGGRVVFGVGAGSSRQELANHGVPPASRLAVLREHVLAVRQIWTSEVAEFHGRHVDFGPLRQWPVQRPHPPILLGGWGRTTFDRVLDHADGWMPNFAPHGGGRLLEGAAELRARADDLGRPRPQVAVCNLPPDPDLVRMLRDGGVDLITFALPAGPTDDTVRRLDEMAAMVQRVD